MRKLAVLLALLALRGVAPAAECATAEDVERIVAEVTTRPHYLCRIKADGRTIRCKGYKVVVQIPVEDAEFEGTK